MDDIVFALNSTIPVFLIILLGFFLQKVHLLNDAFNKTANEFVFRCALPVNLFHSIAVMDFRSNFDPAFCLFCFGATTVMFLGVWAASWWLLKDKGQVGAFAQASVRSSAAILGVAFAVNIYGDSGMVPMMIMSAVPFFNVYSVLILGFSPQVNAQGVLLPAKREADAVKKACLNILKNPMILGIAAGLPFSLMGIRLPTALNSAVNSIGATASPIALLVVGASFSGSEAVKRWKGAVGASFIKLFLLPAVFLPVAVMLNFRQSELVAILIMLGSPTTVTSYVMAKSMHGDTVLSSNAVLLSTLLGAVSITFWLYLLRSFSLI